MSAVETPQSKNQAVSQATVYSSIPDNGPASSDSGVYHPPPEPVISQPEEHPLAQSYSKSEMAQYESIHPPITLSDVNAERGSEAVYNYAKNQPSQIADVLTLQKSDYNDSGLVDIYAGTETKNGITTEKTVTPELAYTETLYGKTFPLYYPAPDLNRGGEAVSFLRVPFAKSLGMTGIGTSTETVQETRLTDPLQFAVGLGSGLISKGTGLLAKVLLKEANPLTEVTIEESKNIKIPNTKTSTGIIGTEESQTRGTAQFGKTGVSSTSTGLGGGGETGVITPKPVTSSTPSVTGIFEKTETPGKGTTGVFQGDIKKGLSTSTPDLKNTKLEYISNSLGGNKGGISGKGEDLGGGGTKIETSKPLFTGKTEDVLKSFTSKPKSEIIKQEQIPTSKQKEDTFLKSFKSAEQIVSTSLVTTKTKTTLTETIKQEQKPKSALSLLQKNVQDKLQVSNQEERLKPESLLVIKSKSDILNKSNQEETEKYQSLFKQTSIQETAQITKQKTEQVQQLTTKTNETTGKETNNKDRGFIPLIPPLTLKVKKIKSRKANEVNFLGAAPVSDVVGLTRRADITYGNKITAGLVRKDISHTKSRKPNKYNLYEKISGNKKYSKKLRI